LPILISFLETHYAFSEEIALLPHRLSDLSIGSIVHYNAAASPADVVISIILLFSSFVWLISYQLGLLLNLRYSQIRWAKRIMLHIQIMLLCPIIGIVETFPAFWAIMEYSLRRNYDVNSIPVYDFYIVSK
jgi:beta-1,4-mannosyltransferase